MPLNDKILKSFRVKKEVLTLIHYGHISNIQGLSSLRGQTNRIFQNFFLICFVIPSDDKKKFGAKMALKHLNFFHELNNESNSFQLVFG